MNFFDWPEGEYEYKIISSSDTWMDQEGRFWSRHNNEPAVELTDGPLYHEMHGLLGLLLDAQYEDET